MVADKIHESVLQIRISYVLYLTFVLVSSTHNSGHCRADINKITATTTNSSQHTTRALYGRLSLLCASFQVYLLSIRQLKPPFRFTSKCQGTHDWAQSAFHVFRKILSLMQLCVGGTQLSACPLGRLPSCRSQAPVSCKKTVLSCEQSRDGFTAATMRITKFVHERKKLPHTILKRTHVKVSIKMKKKRQRNPTANIK
jgi:hypothetical protein